MSHKTRAILVDAKTGEPIQLVEVPDNELHLQGWPGTQLIVEPDRSITDATHRRDLERGEWVRKERSQ